MLNSIADNNSVRNDIENAAPYVNSFQTNFCLKKNNVIVEPSRGIKYINEKMNDCCT